jgi:hypothetical protein
MNLAIEDMSTFGQARMEDDYEASNRRGGRASRVDFAEGWMALAVRHRLWSYFTLEARARLEEQPVTAP